MITIDNLSKRYGKLQVLENLSLKISDGRIFTILGPNGSGKTTLIKSILGLVIPQKGYIKINSENIIGKFSYRNQIDYLPQIANFPPNLRVSELIEMIGNFRLQSNRSRKLIELFGITKHIDKKINTLSGGTRQKVNLILGLMFDSPILIMDEPTSGLDPVSIIQLKKLIKDEKEIGKTIIITSHIMDFVEEISDEIVFLLEGKIYFQGSLDEIKLLTGENKLEGSIATILKKNHV